MLDNGRSVYRYAMSGINKFLTMITHTVLLFLVNCVDRWDGMKAYIIAIPLRNRLNYDILPWWDVNRQRKLT